MKLICFAHGVAAALQHFAVTKGLPVAYEKQTQEARSIRANVQNKVRVKWRFNAVDDAQGPPDKRSDFGKLITCIQTGMGISH